MQYIKRVISQKLKIEKEDVHLVTNRPKLNPKSHIKSLKIEQNPNWYTAILIVEVSFDSANGIADLIFELEFELDGDLKQNVDIIGNEIFEFFREHYKTLKTDKSWLKNFDFSNFKVHPSHIIYPAAD